MNFAFRMALLDAKASRGRFLFIVLAIAAGVAALTGVKGFSESVRYTLFKEARTLMGADLMIRMNSLPNEAEQAFLKTLAEKGIDHTHVTETVSMAASGPESTPVLSSIKAADLQKYPFYGVLEFDPPSPPITADTVSVSEDLLFRLSVKVGDSIKVGAHEFRIVAVSRKEPDRMTTGFTLGPRVLMSREGFERTGLNVFGSRATQRILLRLPAESDVEAIRSEIRDTFRRRGRVIDYTQANPTLSRNMERASSFLAMVSLIALIVGGVGVATSIESHIQQRMDHVAIMKCLGGSSRRVMQVYAAQSLMLGVAGSLVGVLCGFVAQSIFPQFLAGYFDVDIDLVLSWKPAVQGISVGVLTTLLFTLPPLLSITRIRPALIFRRDLPESRSESRSPRALVRGSLAPVLSVLAIALGIWLIAVWMSGSSSRRPHRQHCRLSSHCEDGDDRAPARGDPMVVAALSCGASGSREPVPARHARHGDPGCARSRRHVHADSATPSTIITGPASIECAAGQPECFPRQCCFGAQGRLVGIDPEAARHHRSAERFAGDRRTALADQWNSG